MSVGDWRVGGLKVTSRRSLLCVAILLTATAQANPVKLFKAGNAALAEGRFDDAVNAFQEAAEEAPEAANIFYNLGHAHYRAGAFEAAEGAYQQAASLAKTDALRSRSWYNMANCIVKSAEQLRAEEPQMAMQLCHQAAALYRTALEYEVDFPDAAYNLEISQQIAASIAEEIRKKEEKQQQENELVKYIRKKLEEFIERQTQLIAIQEMGEPQKILEKETRALAKVMEDSGLHQEIELPDGSKVLGPLKETFEHTLKAADAMIIPDPPTALAELVAALGSAPDDPDQNESNADEDSEEYDDSDMNEEESDQDAEMYEEADPFGDFSEYEEIRGVPPPNQTETDILSEEIRNQERRKGKKAGEYKKVEKDW